MKPLAERMRPHALARFVGQEHLVGPGAVLRLAIERGQLSSFILWGPPGVGKTTLARIIAQELDRPFHTLSAVSAGVKEVREVIDKAKRQRFFDQPNPVLFIDEIHRFNKAQQDSLLGAVEEGVLTLIGATTENPSFEVIPALLSRCQVYTLDPLGEEQLLRLLRQALETDEYLRELTVVIQEHEALLRYSGGDARKLYNALELVCRQARAGEKLIVTNALCQAVIQENMALYDKDGEWHYDIASAFIKSIRGGDPNAALYWMARMIEGGENVRFIARRIMIAAAEDIGLANPNALLMAVAAFQAAEAAGLPEARIILAQAVVYLAASPKSNSVYLAIDEALALARRTGDLPVPPHLRNAPTALMKDLGYGRDYRYAHDFPGHFTPQEYLPEEIAGAALFKPQDNEAEARMRQRLKHNWKEKYGY
jgi:putative ATPase